MSARQAKPIVANRLFFPAAALHAAFVLPLSVQAMVAGAPVLPGLQSATGHAHEMLFGFAAAVVAGFLITQTSPARLYALFGAWLLARLGFIFEPAGTVSTVANLAFAGGLVAETAPRFIRAAKKLRNQVFGPLLIGIGALIVAFSALSLAGYGHWRGAVVAAGVALFAALLGFMGGRFLAPAAANQLQHRGVALDARLQPRLEGGMLVALALSAAAAFLASPQLAGGLLFLAGLLLVVRLLRWRPWLWMAEPALLGLVLGYAWLGVGLLLHGGLTALAPGSVAAVHAVTIGALGTLTLTVMARTRIQRARRDTAELRQLHPALALLSLAAVVRLAAGLPQLPVQPLLLAASLAWSLAFLLLFRLLLMVPAR
ncbi:NnrS family protein [Ectothiorhodospiraceae bacterium WFHF3C12]|nr:NnrS family protein [Ectothiorhodospiraceae bacterium WFHF3C12]